MLQIFNNARCDDRNKASQRTVAWRRRITALGGTDPAGTANIVPATLDFCEGMEAAALWGRIPWLNHFAGGNEDAHAACLTGQTATMVGGLTHDAGGVQGNGSTGRIDTGVNPSTFFDGEIRDSGFILGLNHGAPIDSTKHRGCGIVGAVGISGSLPAMQVTRSGINIYCATGEGILADPTLGANSGYLAAGLYGAFVEADGSGHTHINATALTPSVATTVPAGQAPPNGNFPLIARYSPYYSAYDYSTVRVYFFAFTKGLTATEYATLHPLIANLQTALGR